MTQRIQVRSTSSKRTGPRKTTDKRGEKTLNTQESNGLFHLESRNFHVPRWRFQLELPFKSVFWLKVGRTSPTPPPRPRNPRWLLRANQKLMLWDVLIISTSVLLNQCFPTLICGNVAAVFECTKYNIMQRNNYQLVLPELEQSICLVFQLVLEH